MRIGPCTLFSAVSVKEDEEKKTFATFADDRVRVDRRIVGLDPPNGAAVEQVSVLLVTASIHP
jgi:hypothetical protein